jgi:hypothetical protein
VTRLLANPRFWILTIVLGWLTTVVVLISRQS